MTTSQRILIVIGSVGPLGRCPASGSVTVLVVGLPLFWLSRDLSTGWYVAITTAFGLASVWLHTVGDRVLGTKDSRLLVWDEIAGFAIAVIAVPFTWQTAALAFFLERTIDILKIQPAHWIERRLPGGIGVVGDDVVAGLYTLAILHLLIRFAPGFIGVGG